jgi:hypothetical protein
MLIILVTMLSQQACTMAPVGAAPREWEPATGHGRVPEGQWVLKVTGPDYASTGRLELRQHRNFWTGRIWLDTIQQWEELRDVFFDSRTGSLRFFRPSYGQQFSGILSGDQLVGTLSDGRVSFTIEGRPFLARTQGPEGEWVFNITGPGYASIGRLEFRQRRNFWTGRIWLDTIQQWEELRDVFFDFRTSRLRFFRPSYGQQFSGTLSGDQLVGTLSDGRVHYTMEGGPARAQIPVPEGQWALKVTGPDYASTGRLELRQRRNFWTGRIWLDTIQQWEELRDVFFNSRTGSLRFFRPSYGQQFSGILSGDQLVGTLGDGRVAYSVAGRRSR